MYVEYLESDGFQPLPECKANEALKIAISTQPDVVVTDLVLLSVDSGIDLIRRLRADPRTARTCIVVVTGLKTSEHRSEALTAGADSFLLKPCLPEVLTREIRRCLRAKRRKTIRR